MQPKSETIVVEFSYNDRQLTEAVLSGDQRAFEQMFRNLYNRLKAFAMAVTQDEKEAEDIVQDSFLSLWEIVHRTAELPKDPTSPPHIRSVNAYLFQTVRNRCMNYAKHMAVVQQVMVMNEDEELIESLTALDMQADAAQDTIYKELKNTIEALIAQMPARQREVFLLSREQQLSNAEIAQQCGVSVKAVEKHITASLKYLREHLKEEHLMALLYLIIKINAV